MQQVERKTYTPQFGGQAVQLVLAEGYTCAKAAKQLGVDTKTLANWVRPQRRTERPAEVAAGVARDDPAALKARIAELEKQFRRTEMEREISSKFGPYVASRRPGGLT